MRPVLEQCVAWREGGRVRCDHFFEPRRAALPVPLGADESGARGAGVPEARDQLLGRRRRAVAGGGACRQGATVNASNAEATAQRLVERLHKGQTELGRERQITALPPVLKGAALVIQKGFCDHDFRKSIRQSHLA
jgi:hypothetical protein